jgi:hypothetical protein
MKKTLAIIAIVMLASLSMVGCVNYTNTTSSSPTPTATPTATPAANADYSSYYTKTWQGSGFIVTQPFTQSTNVRGNDIYMGIMKNATLASTTPMTVVMELAKTEAQAKQVYDNYVSTQLNAGFTPRSDWIAALNASVPGYSGIWVGTYAQQQFYVLYRYNPYVQSWEVTTEAG